MKKTLLTLGLAMLGIALTTAQRLPAPVVTTTLPWQRSSLPAHQWHLKSPAHKVLGENQLYLGSYTSDALADDGLGLPGYPETFKMGVVLPLSMVQPFNGGVVKAIRIGLCAPIESGQVFIYPVSKTSPLSLKTAVVTQDVSETVTGWNTVELETPYTIDTEGIEGLMIGYQYKQLNTTSGGSYTLECYPISVVEEGEILPSYTLGKLGGTRATWQDIGLSSYGNLSVQAIVEGDFTNYNLALSNMSCPAFAQITNGLPITFNLSNVSTSPLDNYQVNLLIDGQVVEELDSPCQGLLQTPVEWSTTISLDGLEAGAHTVTARVVSVDGNEVADGSEATAQFTAYTQSMPRQKQLVEHFTSQGCTYCYLGDAVLKALDELRGDLAWVSIHGNLNVQDVFNTTKCEQLMSYLGVNSFPMGSFNRFDFEHAGELATGLGYNINYAQLVAEMLSEEAIDANPTPVLADVNINGKFDADTRELALTVAGNATADFATIFGTDVALTVYVVEDSLVARQYSNGKWNQKFVHNHVMRDVLSAVKGDAINWTDGGAYANTFTTTLNSGWDVNHMRVVAFIHRTGTGVNKEVINTEMVAINALVANGIPGDVNGDGNTDIDDVNELINMLLEYKEKTAAADVNGDGNVDIDDVNAVINILLQK
ncbi:MAG: Omp28-related outer membrane protein [Muribaculaceae bacterium]|nr:Omp28-related outer membrane protein [Muribaculaceae bacterium]